MNQTSLAWIFKVCLTACFFLVFLSVQAQKKYKVEKGEVAFTSKAELELIKAKSSQIQGLLDPVTNQFAFTVDVKSLKGFNSELQREHFNEKYMESEVYPKARFSGKIIENLDFSSNNTYEVRAKGDLDIHGIKQTRIIKARLTTESGKLKIETIFFVPLADHNITIPRIVSQKIATEIEVSISALMSPQ
jgi:polyisoprenoid-binding protein YceI